MSFTSYSFFVFLPVVFILYWAAPVKYRWAPMLAGSVYFYMTWGPAWILLLGGTTVLSYVCAVSIADRAEPAYKKAVLWVGAGFALGVLCLFKYVPWLWAMLGNLCAMFGMSLGQWTLRLAMPVGISFYTFQTVSYLVDVYRGKLQPERHFGVYAAYITFFPQVISGPIPRGGDLLPQIRQGKERLDYDQAVSALKTMSWGFFKKVLIADPLTPFVNVAFGSVGTVTGFPLILGIVLFAIQLYCDFSGYSDLAIGTARLFGIELKENFRTPYFASSLKEFWGRWHISLSTWFRDYVYIPLGGSRCGRWKSYRNLVITFAVSGLWHGAGLNYLVWGLLHGLGQCAEKALGWKADKPWKKVLGTFGLFLFCCLTWVFFRAGSLGDALWILAHLFDGIGNPVSYIMTGVNAMKAADGVWGLLNVAVPCAVLVVMDFVSTRTDWLAGLKNRKLPVRWLCYIAMTLPWVLKLISLIVGENTSSFIYFQF